MPSFDDLVSAATHRLRVDRELQWDVQQELRAHLDDAAEEYREAGYSDADAQREAAQRFGDADELADAIWQANRRRLRWRSVVRWTVRLAVPPLMLLAVLAVPAWQLSNRSSQAVVEAIAEHRSGSPVDQHVGWLIRQPSLFQVPQDHPALIEAGQRLEDLAELEPESAVWPLIEASVRYVLASEPSWDEKTLTRFRIADPDGARAARRLIGEAVSRPRFSTGNAERAAEILHGFDSPRTAAGLLEGRVAAASAVVERELPLLSLLRTAAHLIAQDALALADAGDAAGARRLAADLRHIGRSLTQQHDMFIGMLNGVSIYARALDTTAQVEEALGDEAAAARSREILAELKLRMQQAKDQMRPLDRAINGPIAQMLAAAPSRGHNAEAAVAAADRAAMAQAVLSAAAALAAVVVALAWVVTGVQRWRRRGQPAAPVLLLPSRRTIALAVAAGGLVGVVLLVTPSASVAVVLGKAIAGAAALVLAMAAVSASRVTRLGWRFARVNSTIRTAVPLLAIAILATVVVAAPIAAWREANAVAALHKSDLMTLVDEVERSPYGDEEFRDWVVQSGEGLASSDAAAGTGADAPR